MDAIEKSSDADMTAVRDFAHANCVNKSVCKLKNKPASRFVVVNVCSAFPQGGLADGLTGAELLHVHIDACAINPRESAYFATAYPHIEFHFVSFLPS